MSSWPLDCVVWSLHSLPTAHFFFSFELNWRRYCIRIVIFFGIFFFVASFSIALVFKNGTSNSLSDDVPDVIFTILFFPFIGLGIWLRTLLIRILATLCHPVLGIKNLPKNWHSITWCKDFTHPPSLLPKAQEVHSEFTVSGLLALFHKTGIGIKTLSLVLLPIWYIPAFLWRWSLKATLWLWWPLALSLKKPFQTATMPQIRDAIVTIVAGWWKLLLMPIPVIIPWLLSGYFPTEISGLVDTMPGQINKLFDKLISYAVPHPNNLRYAAICLVCTLSIVIWWKASAMKTLFKMIIDDETYIIQHDIENDPKYSELKQKFYHRAKGIARWHTWRIVSFILLGYSYILYLAYAWYPQQAGRVIPEWLIPYL